jgi:hypothetical protein
MREAERKREREREAKDMRRTDTVNDIENDRGKEKRQI